jgi:tRNA pseudouridine55 synthase
MGIIWRSLQKSSNILTNMAGPIHEGVFGKVRFQPTHIYDPRLTLIAIHKPPGITSAQVIRDVQKQFNPSKLFKPWLDREKNNPGKRRWKGRKQTDVKIGHGGTLDPLATGVLILGIGSGTKDLGYFMTACTKTYETVVLFGAATDTYDVEGKVVARKPFDHITKEVVEEALDKFRGEGMQKPPIFSALRVEGKRLYEYAREGKPLPEGFEIKERPVEVSSLEMLEWHAGGTHKWHWPTQEAETAEKNLAQQALHFEADTTTKRKSDDENDASPAKRIKAEEPDALAAEKTRLTREEEGGQPGTEVAQPPKDELQPATSRAAAEADEETAAEDATDQPPPCPAPACKLRMKVTSGFYVRSLCHDLGAAVGSLATMAELVRTQQSDFALSSNVLEYEDVIQGEAVWGEKVQKLLEEWNEKKAKASE